MRGRILKGMGLKAGAPDLVILYDSNAYFLELKSEKGVLSEPQRRAHAAIRDARCPVVVVRSLDDVKAALLEWRIPTREAKPTIEATARGFRVSGGYAINWPESAQLGRRKRRAKDGTGG
jgi:hypothetical protein